MLQSAVTPVHTYTVSSTADTGPGTLRAALASATTDNTFDEIILGAHDYTVSSDQLVASDPKGIEIVGAGATSTGTTITQSGAFRVLQVTNGTPLWISGVTLTGGNAGGTADDGNGGGIEVLSGFLKLSHSVVKDSQASGNGGGIFVSGDDTSVTGSAASQADLEYVTLSGNSAGSDGGGLNDANQVLANHLTVNGNNTAAYGAGIYVDWVDDTSSNFTGSAVTVAGNTASSEGGGLFNYESTVALTSSTIGGTSAADANTAPDGGGIYNEYGTDTLSNVNVEHNIASSNDGGGIYDYYADEEISGGTIGGNTAKSYGGGVYQDEYSLLDTTSTRINGNVAGTGGGGIYSDYSMANLAGGTLNTNIAEPVTGPPTTYTGDGGGAYVDYASDFEAAGTTISNNQAEYGGGIYSSEDNTVRVTGSTMANNNNVDKTVAYEGGAIYADDTTNLVAANDTFSSNTAEYGGAIYLSSESPARITTSKFISNVADLDGEGGAIYNDSEAGMTIVGSSFSGNQATTTNASSPSDTYGGALYLSDSPITMRSDRISGGIATWGGGLYVYEYAAVRISGSTITGNRASNGGGGIGNDYDTVLTLDASAVTANKVGGGDVTEGYDGGGIANWDSASLVVTNSTIAGNSLGTSTGNVYGAGIDNEAQATLDNDTIAYNTAPSGNVGTAIGNGYNGSLSVKGSVLEGASAVCSNTGNGASPPTGTINSAGANVSNDASCNLNAPADRHSVALHLGTLGGHGGPTATVPLLAGSPAINDETDCPAPSVDQRGVPRPAGACDSGAYERTPGHVSHVSPTRGKKGTKVTITGSGFYFVSKVKFGRHTAHIVKGSPTKLIVVAPSGPRGLRKRAHTVTVRVYTPDGYQGVGHFTYKRIRRHHRG